MAACVLKHQIHRYVSVCYASSPCASSLHSATRLHLFSNKLIPRGRSTPLLPWRCLSAPVLQGWIWDSALTDAAMARVFLKHPPHVTPSCNDQQFDVGTGICEKETQFGLFFSLKGHVERHPWTVRHSELPRSIGSPLSPLLIDFSSCRLISVHVCSRGSGLTRQKNLELTLAPRPKLH